MTWIYVRRFTMDFAFMALGAGWQYSLSRYLRAKATLSTEVAE